MTSPTHPIDELTAGQPTAAPTHSLTDPAGALPEDPEVTAAFRELERSEQLALTSKGRYTLRLWHIGVLAAGLALLPTLTSYILG